MRMWRIWMAVGAVLTAVVAVFPVDSVTTSAVYYGVGVATVSAAIIGIRRHRPFDAPSWYLFVTGLACFVAGDLMYEIMGRVLGEVPYPYWNDALYLVAYPFLWGGILLVAHRRGGRRDTAGAIDAAIIAVAAGLVYWVFLIDPILGDRGTPLLERLVTAAYPTCDVLLLAVVARLLTRAQGRTPSMLMLAAGSGLTFVCDVFWTFSLSANGQVGSVVNAGYVFGYILWAGAALHPSMRTDAGPAGATGFGRGRLAVLTASTLLVPAVLFAQGLRHDPVNWAAVGVGSIVLFLLVLTRMSGFVGQVQKQAAQLKELAMHDELTGLANRRRFETGLAEAVAAGPAQVCLLDLNGFKQVNDRLGHAVGDRLLVVVATRLAAELRDVDLVARMGGDEFAILVPGASAAEGDAIVDRLAAVLREPVTVDGHELLVGGSIGIADTDGTADPVEVLRRADVAMYAAKAAGGRYRRYAGELDNETDEESRLGAELRTALDAGHFHLVYQPIVSLPDGRVLSVESLVRWRHPERGLVSPAAFVPVAERIGLIVELGEWILRTACDRFMTWQREHGAAAPGQISVNVSARQLAEPGFTALVADVLSTCGMAAHQLVIEVTETAVFGGGAAVRAVKDLHELGVRIALDDFGTGHSSLGLLQTIPVDVLKVDKSFVDDITEAGRQAVIATALIQVAHGLGVSAVAEGVETAEQADELYRLGYRIAQGYHFGRPAEALQLPAAA